MKLPIVSEETIIEALAEISGDKNFLSNFMKTVKKENPQVAEVIFSAAKSSKDITKTLYAGVITYILLKKQAETKAKK